MLKRLLILAVALLALPQTAFAIRDVTGTGDNGDYALEWPVAMPDADVISAAQSCGFDHESRYPASLAAEDLADAYAPESGCDWALLALAYASRAEGDTLPDEAHDAFIEAVRLNSALPFSLTMLQSFWGVPDVVAPPDYGPLESVEIHFTYQGLGSYVFYEVTLNAQADQFAASGKVGYTNNFQGTETDESYDLDTTVDAELVSVLGTSGLANLLPISQQFSAVPCWDNYPSWWVKLTFEDGAEVVMETNGSNVLDAGGPWQTTIDGQDYMQMGPDFLLALLDVADALDLPRGETAAMGCGGMDDPLFQAFPGPSEG